jgi:choline kinase
LAAHFDIFILMAGLGNRFRSEGYEIPKPLIKFRGQPLFAWALKSVKDLLPQSNLHLVLCAEDNIQDKIELELAKIKDLNFHTVHIISLPKRTNGPLETAVQAVRQTAAQDRSNPVVFFVSEQLIET